MHVTPRPDQLAEPTVLTSRALVSNPSIPSTPDPVIPEGSIQKEFDDLKQALSDALKNAEDMKKKLDSSLSLSSTSDLPTDSGSSTTLLRTETTEQQLSDLQNQNDVLKTEFEKANDDPLVEVQILTAQLTETKAQDTMQQLQTREIESELQKFMSKLTATETTVRVQPSDESLE